MNLKPWSPHRTRPARRCGGWSARPLSKSRRGARGSPTSPGRDLKWDSSPLSPQNPAAARSAPSAARAWGASACAPAARGSPRAKCAAPTGSPTATAASCGRPPASASRASRWPGRGPARTVGRCPAPGDVWLLRFPAPLGLFWGSGGVSGGGVLALRTRSVSGPSRGVLEVTLQCSSPSPGGEICAPWWSQIRFSAGIIPAGFGQLGKTRPQAAFSESFPPKTSREEMCCGIPHC